MFILDSDTVEEDNIPDHVEVSINKWRWESYGKRGVASNDLQHHLWYRTSMMMIAF